MNYFTTTRLSENMEFTPEGYLLCKGVAIARTGVLEYLPEEVPEEVAKGTSNKIILVYRRPEDLFSKETIASYEGKDVTVDHPEDFVTPENWRALTVGHAQNVRRGEGEEQDLLLADLLIKDQETIDLILPPKQEDGGTPLEPLREVSCGYDAEYKVVSHGVGQQISITGNHIALVNHGRCGSRCAIKDKDSNMGKQNKKSSFWDKVFGNSKVQKAMADAAQEEQAKDNDEVSSNDDATEQQTTTDGDGVESKLDEILILLRSFVEGSNQKDSDVTEVGDDAPEKTNDDDDPEQTDCDPEKTNDDEPDAENATKTGDSLSRVTDSTTLAMARKMAPGIRFHSTDSATSVKRTALRVAMQDGYIAKAVQACLGKTPLNAASGAALQSAFRVASEFTKSKNNTRTADALSHAKNGDSRHNIATPADINKRNKEFNDSNSKKG